MNGHRLSAPKQKRRVICSRRFCHIAPLSWNPHDYAGFVLPCDDVQPARRSRTDQSNTAQHDAAPIRTPTRRNPTQHPFSQPPHAGYGCRRLPRRGEWVPCFALAHTPTQPRPPPPTQPAARLSSSDAAKRGATTATAPPPYNSLSAQAPFARAKTKTSPMP